MRKAEDSKALLRDLLWEEALLIGSLAATHDVDEEVVWFLCRNLDQIRLRFLRRLEPAGNSYKDARSGLKLRPHPAVQELLRRIREY